MQTLQIAGPPIAKVVVSSTASAFVLDDLEVFTSLADLKPGITSQPVSQAACMSSNAVFCVIATGRQPLSYQWQFNGTNLTWATNACLLLSNVQPAQAGNYTVVVSNSFGSVTSAIARLVIGAAWLELTSSSGSEPLHLALYGELGQSYLMETSTNLRDWTWLTVLQTTNGAAILPVNRNEPKRFFRARLALGDEVWFEQVPAGTLGQMTLTFHGYPGRRCEIWTSTNLTQWTVLRTVTNNTGTVVFTDTMTNGPARFYRLRQLP
jgi:hypothetical protein